MTKCKRCGYEWEEGYEYRNKISMCKMCIEIMRRRNNSRQAVPKLKACVHIK